jgi:hypothetical protein
MNENARKLYFQLCFDTDRMQLGEKGNGQKNNERKT